MTNHVVCLCVKLIYPSGKLNYCIDMFNFVLPRDVMHKRSTSCRLVGVGLSVCLSVCRTLVHCIETAKDTIKLL